MFIHTLTDSIPQGMCNIVYTVETSNYYLA